MRVYEVKIAFKVSIFSLESLWIDVFAKNMVLRRTGDELQIFVGSFRKIKIIIF